MLRTLLACCCLILFSCQMVFASPLTDFARGNIALDLNWRIHSFEGGTGGPDFSVTGAMNDRWALNYRQTSYDPEYNGFQMTTKNQEMNLVYKFNPTLQAYAGWSRTAGHDRITGLHFADKNVSQIGLIAQKKLSKGTTLYTVLGGGNNVANVEFGLSHELRRGLELTATYRHLTVEEVGINALKENLRGFGLGITLKF